MRFLASWDRLFLLEEVLEAKGLTLAMAADEMPAGCWEAMRLWLLRVFGRPPLGDPLAWECWILPTYLASLEDASVSDEVILEKAQELVQSLLPSVFGETAG